MGGLLHGRVAIITGGGAGIGAEIARVFAAEGCSVLIADRDADSGARMAESVEGQSVVVDVRQEAQVRALIAACQETYGSLDVLVNNAGVCLAQRTTEQIDIADWDETFAVNVRGVVLCIKHATPLLKRRAGVIINMSSVVGWRADPKQCAYSASKAAVISITQAVAQDLGRYGIRVNALCPGPVSTEALLGRVSERAAAEGRTVEQAVEEDYASKTAMGRIMSPGDVAAAALFLATDAASGITGHHLDIDGGTMQWKPKDDTAPM